MSSEHIFYFEKWHDPFSLKILGVNYYELIRYDLLGKIQESRPRRSKEIFSRNFLTQSAHFLREIGQLLMVKVTGKNDILFFSESRRMGITDDFSDIYLDELLSDMPRAHAVLVIDFSKNKKLRQKLLPNESYLNLSNIKGVLSLVAGILAVIFATFCWKKRKQDEELINFISQNSGMPNKSVSRFIVRSVIFHNLMCFLGAFIVSRRAKAAFFCGFLSFEGLIQSCHALSISTFEIQHGSPQENKLNYHFEARPNLQYRCQNFLSWGPFFSVFVRNVYQNCIDFGFPYLEKQRRQHVTAEKKSGILVISQPAVGKLLSNKLMRAAKDYPECNFIFKCHPYERAEDFQQKFINLSNVHVIDGGASIYELFSRCDSAYGVFSTALIESLHFGLSVNILDLPGAHKMKSFLDASGGKLVGEIIPNVTHLEGYDGKSSKTFFADYRRENLQVIEKSIKHF